MAEPEWLTRWRAERVIVDPDVVSKALEPFGVMRKTMQQLTEMIGPAVVFTFVSGRPPECARTARRMGKKGALVVRYEDAKAMVEASKGTPEYQITGMAWSVIRADVSTALRKEQCVIVDRPVIDRKQMQAFNRHCFLSGARAVIAVCVTTEYEEDWDDDGFTGVVWLTN